MSAGLSIVERLISVMEDVGAIRKGERNTSQNFNFRGIDSVVNAVSPALRKHGLVVFPDVLSYEYGVVEVGGKRTPMGHAKVTVRYTFYSLEGESLAAVTVAEAMDSGDKATAKAMSVAFRTALLQALSLPTDEPDPDETTYERSAGPTEAEIAAAREWIDSLDAYDQEGLRAVWKEHAHLLDIDVDGRTLRDAILVRKAALDAAAKAEQQVADEQAAAAEAAGAEGGQ